MFETKKKIKQRLTQSFGEIKDDPFHFDSIEKYFRNKDQTEAFQILSDKTCNDLDFNELFMFVDRTTSKIGQQFLYNTLRTIPSNSDKFTEKEKLIQKITNDSNLRLYIQLQLDKLTRESSYFITTLFQDEYIKKPKWFFIIPILSFSSLMSILLIPFTPQFFFVLLGVMIINLGIHYWNKQNLHEYLGTIPHLLILTRVTKKLLKCKILKEINEGVPESISSIEKIRSHMSFFKLEVQVQTDVGTAFLTFLELFKALFLLEPLLLFGVLKQLDTKRREIENVYSFVGYVDSLVSISSLRHGLKSFCLPQIENNHKIIDATEIYHPLIINCVSNSIQVDGNSILLTGSNMSGKTSFIRTIGLNIITGLTINTCFAKQFCFPRLKIFSAIRLSDSLMNDKSYYFEEVLTIKEMIEKSQTKESNLFLLDEIFKGTNTIERISAGRAVLSYLNSKSNIVFVSTHDIELAEMLKDTYNLYHFSEQVEDKTVDFDFKLKEGKLKNRNAIKILEINDYPEQIITEAIELSKELDKIYVVSKRG
jgi:ABC-type multidrug transport system ATPase subunit